MPFSSHTYWLSTDTHNLYLSSLQVQTNQSKASMNFLYRTQPAVPELPTSPQSEPIKDAARKPAATLDGLIAAEDPFPGPAPGDSDSDGPSDVAPGRPASINELPEGKHADVLDEDGWIIIPYSTLSLFLFSLRLYYYYHYLLATRGNLQVTNHLVITFFLVCGWVFANEIFFFLRGTP
jgi:hypothetical protein